MSFSELKKLLLKMGFDVNYYDLSAILCDYKENSFSLEFSRKEWKYET